jgi:hypothetical protein
MSDAIIFVCLLLAVVFGYIAYKLPISQWREYFSTRTGKGILKGIILAPLAIIVIALVMSLFNTVSAQGRWFTEAGVFIGLDSTLKQSPQCHVNAVDNRGTSNLGAFVNIWQSQSDRLQVNFKYTHHSCALGDDRNAYDAFGLELRWVLWKR